MSGTQPDPFPTQSAPIAADTAVVIVNWNTRDLLRACLRSLRENQHGRLSRIIVVENASGDGSAAMVREEFPEVTLVTPGENTGYARGNNLGLERVEEPYAFLLNPDTEVGAGVIQVLAEFLDAHPPAAVVAPQLVSPDESVQPSCRGFPTPRALLGEWLRMMRLSPGGEYRMHGWRHDTERQVDQPMGTALMVRMDAVRQVGVMDEQFPLFFNEVDWLYRMKAAGWETWFTPRAKVLHHWGASTRQVWVKAAWLSYRGLHAFYRKHFHGRLHPLLYATMVAAIYLQGVVIVLLRLLQRARAALQAKR